MAIIKKSYLCLYDISKSKCLNVKIKLSPEFYSSSKVYYTKFSTKFLYDVCFF